jgi:DNA-binding CsgD family transcriptional regulator
MDPVERFDHVVSAVYEAALQPALWPYALDAVAGLLSCDLFHCFVWDLQEERPLMTWASPSATSALHRGYDVYYGRIDPRRRFSEVLEPGTVFACHHQLDEKFVANDEFYQDFLIPGGMRYMVGSTLAFDAGSRTSLALLRATGRPEFSADDMTSARRIAPHLRRCMEMMLRQRDVADALAAGDRALDGLDMAVAVLDDAAGVRHLNPSAQRMLREGACWRVRNQRLEAKGRLCSARLQQAWQHTRDTGRPASALLHGAEGPQAPDATVITFCRLPTGGPGATLPGGRYLGRYLALIARRARRAAPDAALLTQIFDLTPAEGRLAHDLARGLSLADAAASRGLRVSTVRTQLLGLLAKTGTQRQQDLVAVLARIPQPGW